MKTRILLSGLIMAVATMVRAGTNDLTSALQRGLFEEEANHNLAAAIAAYQSVIARFDTDRKLAATAVYRLGECYRKLGSTNEAAAQYERILREFSDQAPLAEMSRQRLPAQAVLAGGRPAASQEQKALLDEEIKLVEQRLATEEKTVRAGYMTPEALVGSRRDLIELKLRRAALNDGQPSAIQEQKALLDEESKLVERRLATEEILSRTGQVSSDTLSATRRDLLELRIRRAALDSGQSSLVAAAPAAAVTTKEQEEIARIQELVKNSPDLINAKEGGETPLDSAAGLGRVQVARYLLENGADVNATDSVGATPLCRAADNGHRVMAELLLEHGAAVDAADNAGETPLHKAAAKGFKSLAELLLANKAGVNARDGFGDTPLHKAAAAGQVAVMELLLAHQADINATNSWSPSREIGSNEKTKGATPLVQAIRSRQVQAVKLLLARNAGVNVECEFYNVQHPPIRPGSGAVQASTELLFNGPQYLRCSALCLAVAVNSPEIVALLLDRGANPNVPVSSPGQNIDGWTPLGKASADGQREAAEMLLAHKADLNVPDAKGRTPLHHAVARHAKEIVKLLLANHADVNRQDVNGETPLIHAAQVWTADTDTDIAAALLDAKADPNLKDKRGRAPLDAAIRYGPTKQALVELLLAKGADPNVRDNDGGTPLAAAKQFQNGQVIADLLRKHGAIEELPQMAVIEVRRPSAKYSEIVFPKGTNNYNRFTLSELIAAHYGFITADNPAKKPQAYVVPSSPDPDPPGLLVMTSDQAPAGWVRKGSLPFPNLDRVVIRHPTADGLGWTDAKVNLNQLRNILDLSYDPTLAWGDVVEIPEADHPINAAWQGLPDEIVAWLKRCVTRQVRLTVKGQTTNLVLSLQATAPLRSGKASFYRDRLATPPSFALMPVLQSSGLLRASSDLSRVKVKRHDAATGQTYELVFDCSGAWGTGPDFWLRNGDEIEVPEKP